ncbi:hypothetical protein ACHHYP_12899 [Achlya hypogyna]|uniref:cDENN domain-containing protein n=1 Tax=Achlya hypogyna TaxID=1202772 RepID=A0A1V9ZGF4_ACHHY|nr:hypothetical protein ACHHYP_12899 [Achlya hypogyna]
MDRLLLGRYAEDVEDWSSDFSIALPPPPRPGVRDDGDDDDDIEDWDKELLSCSTLDCDGYAAQREENNSFFRSLLPNLDLLPPSPTAQRAGLPDTHKLLECARSTFRNTESAAPLLAFAKATPLLTLEADGFPVFSEAQLEEWLSTFVQNKEDAAMAQEGQFYGTAGPTEEPSASTRDTLQDIACRLSYCIRRGRLEPARVLLTTFFARVEGEAVDDREAYIMGGWCMEVVQLAIEVLVPSTKDGTQAFGDVVQRCHQRFPAWRAVWGLLECRYVLHHWATVDSYPWQVLLEVPPDTFAAEGPLGLAVLRRLFALFALAGEEAAKPAPEMTVALDMGLLSLGTSAAALQAAILCDVQSAAERRSPLCDEPIPAVYRDDAADEPPSAIAQLFEADSGPRLDHLEGLYTQLAMPHDLFVKAKVGHVLSRALLPVPSAWPLGESLAVEALRLLDVGYPLAYLKGPAQRQGLLGAVGRDCLEATVRSSNDDGLTLLQGALLTHGKKYRFAIAAYESAARLYCFQHLNRRGYEKLDRLCSGLCLHEGDLARALLYHDRVLQWSKEQENRHEYVYIVQMINGILLQQSQFRLAEQRVAAAFVALLDPTAPGLPPPCMSPLPPRSFHFKALADLDSWLLQQIQLHLCLRDIYRATGRWQEALRVLQHVLAFEPRVKLPRGQRAALTLLAAEDALKTRQLELCLSLLRTVEQDAPDSRPAFETLASLRYATCRSRCYFFKEQFHRASYWLGVASAKAATVREQADVALATARCLLALHARTLREADAGMARTASVRWSVPPDAPALRLLTPTEQATFAAFMEHHGALGSYVDEGYARGLAAAELYATLHDRARELKALLLLLDHERSLLERALGVVSVTTVLAETAPLGQLEAWAARALALAAETARPLPMAAVLATTALVRCWRLQASPLGPSAPPPDVTQLYEQAARLLQGVFLRHDPAGWVLQLPFAPGVVAKLEQVVGALLLTGATLSALGWLPAPDVLSLAELGELIWTLHATSYWTSAKEVATDAELPALPPLRTAPARQAFQHQKHVSLSSLSELMAAVFRRSPEPADPPFAYVGPLPGAVASADGARGRSYSAPVGPEASRSSAADWDDADLELEADGDDFWRACSQEQRRQTMARAGAAAYAAQPLDALWGAWHALATSDRKYQAGRLSPAAYRLANLRLIHSLARDPPRTDASCDPPRWPWGVLLQAQTLTHTVAIVQPLDAPAQVSRFKSAAVHDWRAAVARLPLNPWLPTADISRVLGLLGAKALVQVLASLLLEVPLVVVGQSPAAVQEVVYILLALLRPFQWHYLVLPFASMGSLVSVVELLHLYTRHKSPSTSEPPFVVGLGIDAWAECTYQLAGGKACAACIGVLHVDAGTFQKAANPAYAVPLPAKLRRMVVDAAAAEHATSATVANAIDRVYDVLLRTCQKTRDFKQWFRLESLEFVKRFEQTWTYQSHVKQGADAV